MRIEPTVSIRFPLRIEERIVYDNYNGIENNRTHYSPSVIMSRSILLELQFSGY